MKKLLIKTIILSCCCFLFQACSLKNTAANISDIKENATKKESMQIAKEYENEYGKITILNKDENKVTLMSASHQLSRGLMINASTDGLSSNDCIITFEDGKLTLTHTSSITKSNSEQLLTRPYYIMNSEISIEGNILFSKGGATINGIYLMDYPDKSSQKGVKVIGTIKREAYPRAYYSTDESPQGKFADDGKVHYRLILENYKISALATYIYEGTVMNQDGKAYFIWDMADSAAYLVDDAPLWPAEKLNKKIKIEAVAITLENGSTLLCNWKIIN
jgi:hypothetical protein